jgi:hypothetical protein
LELRTTFGCLLVYVTSPALISTSPIMAHLSLLLTAAAAVAIVQLTAAQKTVSPEEMAAGAHGLTEVDKAADTIKTISSRMNGWWRFSPFCRCPRLYGIVACAIVA